MRTRTLLLIATTAAAFGTEPIGAQERKNVPSDSVRVFVAGCSKGYIFTAGRPIEDQPGGAVVPEGVHLRMSGPKKVIAEIKRHEGTRIEVTGLIKKGQVIQDGVRVGGVRIGGGLPVAGGGVGSVRSEQIVIDLEGWRQAPGDCRSR